jgi:hypothetical protein
VSNFKINRSYDRMEWVIFNNFKIS